MTFRLKEAWKTHLTPAFANAIYKKYSIVGHFRIQDFDHDFKLFEKELGTLKKESFSSTERIIIEHLDTDYYHPDFPYGLGLYNLITAFKKSDVPLFTILLFTNHFGISKEIDQLSPDPNDRPTVIETFVTNCYYSGIQPVVLNVSEVTRPGVCMMRRPRSHRKATFNFLRTANLLSHVAVAWHGNE